MSEISHSKNTVNGDIHAQRDVFVGDGNTVFNLKEAAYYKVIVAEIAELNERFKNTRANADKYPDDGDFTTELLRIDEKRSQKQQELNTLRREVLKLAEDIQRFPDTKRLRRAKAHFKQGEFAEARAVLDAVEMGRELDDLEAQEKKYAAKIDEIKQHKADKANEYLFLARLTAINYKLPDWYEKTVAYFEQSLRAVRNAENVFAFAYFLQEHNQFTQAQPLYEETLQICRALAKENSQTYLPVIALTLNNLANLYSDKNEFGEALAKYEEALKIIRTLAKENLRMYLPDVAMTLNNLANLQRAKNEFGKALAKYEEALQMYRVLAEENPRTYLPYVATTLNNLANLHSAKNEFGEALANYEEALKMYRALAKENQQMYLPYVAMILNNLANLHSDIHVTTILNNLAVAKNEFGEAQAKYEEALQIYKALAKENPWTYSSDVAMTLNNLGEFYRIQYDFIQAQPFYEEALQIRRALTKENPQTYLPDVAMILNNLALLHSAKNEFGEALAKYEEALQVYRALAEENPRTYLPDVAMTAMNMAIFYLQSVPDEEKSLAYCTEALRAGLPFAEYLPSVQNYLQATMQVAAAWGEDPEAFLQNILTQMNEQPSPLQNTIRSSYHA